MTDLVLLRDLIRDPSARGHSENVDALSRRLRFESLFGCVITRAAYPYPPVAIALPLDLIGVKAINARARSFPELLLCSRRYARRMNTLLRIDLTPQRYKPFVSAMERVYVLAPRNQTTVSIPERTNATDLATRPCSLIRADYTSRMALSMRPSNAKRSHKGEPRQRKSPKTTYSLSFTQTSPTPSSTNDTPGINASQSSHHGRAPSNRSCFPPPDPYEVDSVLSRPKSSLLLGDKQTFDENIKQEVIDLANEFTSTPSLLLGLNESHIPSEKVVAPRPGGGRPTL